MKTVMVGAMLLVLALESALFATTCSEYEDAYLMAELKKNETKKASYRERYNLANGFIDSATAYLAYCQEAISLDEQYIITQTIRREEKKRREYFRGAVREYHAIYGIRPNVTEIYQDGRYGSGATGSPSRAPTPRFPPVQQPMMPPVQPAIPR